MYRNIFKEMLKSTMFYYKITEKECSYFCCVSSSAVRKWKTQGVLPQDSAFEKLLELIYKKNSEIKDRRIHSELTTCVENIFLKENFYLNIDQSDYLCDAFRKIYSACKLKQPVSQTRNNTPNNITEKTKVIVFDFDGTLTAQKTTKTTWESLWRALSYDIRECQDLHKRFDEGNISHNEWCKITETKFKTKNLNKSHLDDIVKTIILIPDIEYMFSYCRKNNIRIYIVSGSIKYIIQESLGELCKYVEEISANEFIFYPNGDLDEIIGTKYDFEGKAKFISEICNKLHISPMSVLFIGNSYNDRFAYLSKARTLCINPKKTDPNNKQVWNERIDTCRSLKEIEDFLT